MQMMRLFSVAAAYLLFVNSLLAADSFTSEELRAALDQWAQDLEFRSSFVYREGRANSQMDAFDDDPISHMTSSATGLFHKAGTTIRYSFVPDDGPKIVGVPDANGTVQPVTESASGRSPNAATGQVIIRGASQDEIYNKDLILTYSPAWKQFYDRATFTNRSATPGDSHQAVEPSSVDRLSPMNPVPGCSGGFPGSMQGAAAATEYVVENIDDTHVAVLAESHSSKTQVSNKYRAEWSLEYDVPVIVRTFREHTSPSETVYVESRLSEIRRCGGAHMAARVVVAIWDKGADSVFVREWKSDDLGKLPPSGEDFVIDIPASTVIVGLVAPPAAGNPRRLTLQGLVLESLRPDDLLNSRDPTIPTLQNSPQRNTFWWVLVFNLVVIAVLG